MEQLFNNRIYKIGNNKFSLIESFQKGQLFPNQWCRLSSANNLCKQFRPRSGPTECSGSKQFDRVVLKEFFEKKKKHSYFWKKVSREQQMHEKLPSIQWVYEGQQHTHLQDSKTCLKRPLKKDKTKVLKLHSL